MADSPKKFDKKSRYTEGRGIAGAFEGETVTRRRLMEGTALAAGGVATMAFAAARPRLRARADLRGHEPHASGRTWAPEDDFNDETYVPRVISIDPEIGDAGKTTIYVRTFNRRPGQGDRGTGSAALRRDLDPLRPSRLSGPLHPGVAEVPLPLPRRRLRLPGQGRGRARRCGRSTASTPG